MAGISFEIYLVHEFFLGPVNVYAYCNHFVGYLVLVILSVIAAVVLKKLCSVIKI